MWQAKITTISSVAGFNGKDVTVGLYVYEIKNDVLTGRSVDITVTVDMGTYTTFDQVGDFMKTEIGKVEKAAALIDKLNELKSLQTP